MLKHAYTFIGSALITLSCIAAPTALDCQTSSAFDGNLGELEKVAGKVVDSKITARMFSDVCVFVNTQDLAKNPGPGVTYEYQFYLRKMSGVVPADTEEVANQKIKKMWAENKENFRCYGYSGSFADGKNMMKLAVDNGFRAVIFLTAAKLDLDLNFRDPSDNQTVLDFIFEKKKYAQETPPVNEEKIVEYDQYIRLLRKHGAKLSKEL